MMCTCKLGPTSLLENAREANSHSRGLGYSSSSINSRVSRGHLSKGSGNFTAMMFCVAKSPRGFVGSMGCCHGIVGQNNPRNFAKTKTSLDVTT